MKKANPSKCFKSIIFFCLWQQHYIFWENTEKIMLNGPKDDLSRGSKYFFKFIVWQQRNSNPQPRIRKWTLNHLAKFWVPLQSLKLCACFQQSLDIQATLDCRFTQKRVRDMIITYNHIFVFKMLFTFLNYQCDDEIKLSKLYHSSDSYRFDILNLILVFLV